MIHSTMCSGEGQALLCDIIIIARFLDDDGSTMTETLKNVSINYKDFIHPKYVKCNLRHQKKYFLVGYGRN